MIVRPVERAAAAAEAVARAAGAREAGAPFGGEEISRARLEVAQWQG